MSDRHSTAAGDVIAERVRQVHALNYTPEHDDAHGPCELAAAAAAYALLGTLNPRKRALTRRVWPWPLAELKPLAGDGTVLGSRRRILVKAGALILAAIETIDRASGATGQSPCPSPPSPRTAQTP